MGDTEQTGTALNDQITDAIAQIGQSVIGMQRPFATAAAYQMISHALSLAVQNAVTQQQHSHMLRSALTTAAAKAMLAGKTSEAEAVLKLAESQLVNPDFAAEIGQMREAIQLLKEDLSSLAPSPATQA